MYTDCVGNRLLVQTGIRHAGTNGSVPDIGRSDRLLIFELISGLPGCTRNKMIDFEEELKKFHPSLEVDAAEEAIKQHDLTDMTDVMVEMLRQTSAAVKVQEEQ